MSEQKKCCVCRVCRKLLFALSFLLAATIAEAQAPKASPAKVVRAHPAKPGSRHDDSVASKRAADLALRPQAAHKADALAHFVEGLGFEGNGEMERALDAYRKVLNVDPGQAEQVKNEVVQTIGLVVDLRKSSMNIYLIVHCLHLQDAFNHPILTGMQLNRSRSAWDIIA